jgi:hypothetical protein
MRSRAGWLIAAALVIPLLEGCESTPPDDTKPVTVSGTVTCSSQVPVAGVWISATKDDADSDFASWQTPDTNTPWVATYEYQLPHGSTYNVHVGCGQKPEDQKEWVNEDWSRDAVSGSSNSFICEDPTNDQDHGVCRRVSG